LTPISGLEPDQSATPLAHRLSQNPQIQFNEIHDGVKAVALTIPVLAILSRNNPDFARVIGFNRGRALSIDGKFVMPNSRKACRMRRENFVGCLLLIVFVAFPRIALVLLFLFSNYLQRAYHGLIVPLLGFLFLPLTTLVYAWMTNTQQPVAGVNLLILIVAAVIDLGGLGGGEHHRRRRRQA